jgi:hypothetical protein
VAVVPLLPDAGAGDAIDVRCQESARSRAARSVGAPCAGSTTSTGSVRSDRNPSTICSGVTPFRSHSRGISRPRPKSTSVSPATPARRAVRRGSEFRARATGPLAPPPARGGPRARGSRSARPAGQRGAHGCRRRLRTTKLVGARVRSASSRGGVPASARGQAVARARRHAREIVDDRTQVRGRTQVRPHHTSAKRALIGAEPLSIG